MPNHKNGNKIIVYGLAEIKNLIPGYLVDINNKIDVILALLENHDFARIETLGHGLNGSGGAYGFDVISEIGESLEQAAQERNEEQIRKCVDNVKDYLERVEVIYE